MKKAFIVGLVGFWTVVIIIMVSGLVSYEKGKGQGAQSDGSGDTVPGTTGLSGTDGVSGTEGNPDTPREGTQTSGGAQYMDASYVATHNSEGDCWLIIDKKIYGVTDYIQFHPGGKQVITPLCGSDATQAFTTKNGNGKHSTTAWSLLDRYYIADFNAVIPGTEAHATDPLPNENGAQATNTSIGVSKFSLGDRVEATVEISVRKEPGVQGVRIAKEPMGSKATIKGAPQVVAGVTWVYVTYGDGTTGWSSEQYLKKIVEVPVTTTIPPATVTPPQGALTTTAVATHNSASSCYLIISNKVYDVTQYIPFHPGGTTAIVNYCGKEATTAFNTKGGSGNTHSANANTILAKYLIGSLSAAVPVVPLDTTRPTVTIKNVSDGSTLTGNVTISANATDLAGIAKVEFLLDDVVLRADLLSPYDHALNTVNYTNGTHKLTVRATNRNYKVSSVSISVTIYNAAPITTTTGLTSAVVATHNSASSCYLIINNKVYDVTEYIPVHPGGTNAITGYCGKEATTAFNTKGGTGNSHSANANTLLAGYYKGPLEGATPVNTCTTFTYNTWGSCQQNNTQTRTVKTSSPTGCTGGSPATSQSCTYVPPTTGTTLTTTAVATHNSASSCYLIISNKVYDVTQYIPFHPGGTTAIVNYCGKEATTAFNTKGGSGNTHSANAQSLLANYYIGTIGATVTTCTTFSYSAWGSCQANSTQTRTVTASSPTGCTGGSPLTSQSCTYVPPANACTTFTYSAWGSCQQNNTQTRTVTASSPTGCTGGTPVLSQSCTYVPPTNGTTLTTAEVATHNTVNNCYLIISNKVYDVTQYIPFHPGGTTAIVNYCGKEATTAFNTKGGSGNTHSANAQSLLANYYIGTIGTTVATCSSFTYSAWGSCQADNTQTRTVTASSPTGCTGGSPILSQSCTYTPPTTGTTLTAAQVATHNTANNCYLIVSNKVYDVTQYIPFHPGGTSRITSRCGTDATSAFLTNSAGHAHSQSAKNILAGYYVADLSTAPATCTTFTYSAWGSCQADSTQTRTVTTSSPTGCTGGSPVTSQSCIYVPPTGETCTTFTYSAWGSCQADSTQTRTVTTSSPTGCTGGSPVTSQSCTYTPPQTPKNYSVSVSSGGAFSPASLTLNAGDSITFNFTSGDEQNISFSPSTITGYKLDHDNTSFTRTFSTAGSWTVRSTGGGTGSIVVN